MLDILNAIMPILMETIEIGGFVLVMWYSIEREWRVLTSTEQMVLEAMQLPLGDPERRERARKIAQVQRGAVFKIRLMFIVGCGMVLSMLHYV